MSLVVWQQVSAQLLTLLLLSALIWKRWLKWPPGASLALSSRARWRIRLDVEVPFPFSGSKRMRQAHCAKF